MKVVNYIKEYNKIFRSVCIKAKLISNSNLIEKSENKSKAAWSVVKSGLSCKKPNYSFPDIKLDDKVLDSSLDVAELFNHTCTKLAEVIGTTPCKDEAIKL